MMLRCNKYEERKVWHIFVRVYIIVKRRFQSLDHRGKL